MEDRTEIVETPRNTTEVATSPPRTMVTPAVSASRMDQVESVAYDPYADRRLLAHRISQLVYWVFGLVEALILIRFALKLLGANQNAGFAEFIYGVTYPLVLPFVGLFGTPQARGSVLELHSIVALIMYAVVAWLLAKLAWIVLADNRSAVKTRSTQMDSRA
jgi:hypothetical protein